MLNFRVRVPRCIAMLITSLQLLQMVIGCTVNFLAFQYKQNGMYCTMNIHCHWYSCTMYIHCHWYSCTMYIYCHWYSCTMYIHCHWYSCTMYIYCHWYSCTMYIHCQWYSCTMYIKQYSDKVISDCILYNFFCTTNVKFYSGIAGKTSLLFCY